MKLGFNSAVHAFCFFSISDFILFFGYYFSWFILEYNWIIVDCFRVVLVFIIGVLTIYIGCLGIHGLNCKRRQSAHNEAISIQKYDVRNEKLCQKTRNVEKMKTSILLA